MMNGTAFAITGIHTGIGKTVASAVLTQALQCNYWKPIQAGALSNSDSMMVQNLINNPYSQVLPESYLLNTAASPHLAATIDDVEIKLEALAAPNSDPLLIETAGGVLSPINAQYTVADLLAYYQWPTLLVVQHYLGSISHTLSAIDALKARQVPIMGLIINGDAHESSETFILNYTHLDIIARIPQFTQLDAHHIALSAAQIRNTLPNILTPWNRI